MKKSLLIKLFAVVAMGLCTVGTWAAKPEAGKVYRIVNKAYGKAVCDNGPRESVGANVVDEEAMGQRWLVTNGANANIYRFQSLVTGMYLTSSRQRSAGWYLSDSPTGGASQMSVIAVDGAFAVRCAGDNDELAMHEAQGDVIVSWTASITPSQWDFVEVPMTQGEIDEALSVVSTMDAEVAKQSAYATVLSAIYQDNACTKLKANYQAMDDNALKADANFKSLSATLQAMVLKTKSGDWTETYADNVSWDSDHASKYRVQLYEPYAEGSVAAQLAGIQAYTNMNNPTGIVGNSGDVLYVMVEGKIKEGATLFISPAVGYGMFNSVDKGTQLKEGLNIVPNYSNTGHHFIYYTVKTAEWVDGKDRPQLRNKVTDYEPLKIHIEGGRLNGFFNNESDDLYKADTDEDFYYTSSRAVHPMYDMLGKYIILHFHLFDTPQKADEPNSIAWGLKKIMDPTVNVQPAGRVYSYEMTKIIKEWDNMCFRERTLMGIQSDAELAKYNDELLLGFYEPLTGDKIEKHPAGNTWNTDPGYQYADYFNNRMMGITMQGNLFMNATSWRTAYALTTMSAILNNIGSDSGSLWGPAHEYGHMNQFPMKFAGTTEESNNIFSNVAVYYKMLNTSRSSVPADQLRIFNQDLTYLEHSTWGTTRMFLQLWLYYHACGNNKKFYPRLYELLRNNPRKQDYYLNMRYDQCHFAKMCCIAAQEDLTDYFDSWGFFVPLKNYHIGDYSNFMATLTEEDIAAVKAEIKALGLPKNDQIILIDDRPGSTRDSWYEPSMGIDKAGVLGGVEDFRNKVKASGSMSATLRNDSLVIDHSNGTAGVGFLVYGEDGTLLSFSNDYKFPLKRAASAAIMTNKAKIYAVSADGSRVEVENAYAHAPIEQKLSNLHTLMASMADVYDIIGDSDARVGWYTKFSARDFLAVYDAAAALTADNTTGDAITLLYLQLSEAYQTIKANDLAKNRFIPGSIYKLTNKKLDKVLSSTKRAPSAVTAKDTNDEYQQWYMQVVNAANGTYRLLNVKHNVYFAKPTKNDNGGTVVAMTEKRSEAAEFKLTEDEGGLYTLLVDGEWKTALHVYDSGSVGIEGGGWEASKWYLDLISAHELNGAKVNLEKLVAESTALIEQAGGISIETAPVTLTPEMLFSNAKSQSGEYTFTSFDVLLDNDFNTVFHTNTDDARDSDDGQHHYIGVDLGQGKSLKSIQLTWSNRDISQGGEEVGDDEESVVKVNSPIRVKVQGSNNGSDYTDIEEFAGITRKSGATYTSHLISDGNDYRYFRVMCQSGEGKAHGHYYFCMAEFGISDAAEVAHPLEIYPKVTAEMLFGLRNQCNSARSTLNSGINVANRYVTAYNELLPLYLELAHAMGIETAIDEITVNGPETPAVNGIYDLQGRKVQKAGKGIYIINGVKTLVY